VKSSASMAPSAWRLSDGAARRRHPRVGGDPDRRQDWIPALPPREAESKACRAEGMTTTCPRPIHPAITAACRFRQALICPSRSAGSGGRCAAPVVRRWRRPSSPTAWRITTGTATRCRSRRAKRLPQIVADFVLFDHPDVQKNFVRRAEGRGRRTRTGSGADPRRHHLRCLRLAQRVACAPPARRDHPSTSTTPRAARGCAGTNG
jgi:hypothetical protein